MVSIPSINSTVVVLLFVLVGAVLLAYAYSLFAGPKARPRKKRTVVKGNPGEAGICPLCQTRLGKSEQLKTALFPGEKERICHIFGCPSCLDPSGEGETRRCPVCKKPVPIGAYLFARLFERSANKRHVHILGCASCRLPKK